MLVKQCISMLALNMTTKYNLHFDGFVPVDHVSGEREGLNVDDVHVPAFGADVDPLRLQRQVQARYPAGSSSLIKSIELQ